MTSVRDMARGGLTRRALILATPSLLVPGAVLAAVPSINSVRRRKPTDSECLRIASVDAYDPLSAALRRPPKPSRPLWPESGLDQLKAYPVGFFSSASCEVRCIARRPARSSDLPTSLVSFWNRIRRVPMRRRRWP